MNIKRTHIDLNCDLGEGIGNEAELMPYISSCNIACGGHAGYEATIAKVVSLAKEYKVGVGAHPSFPDKANFGRVVMDISLDELKTSVLKQIGLVAAECKKQEIPLHHIKTHGALYNLSAKEEIYAEMITSLVEEHYPDIPVYAPFNSVMARVAEGRIKVLFEAFADRNYEADGSLVSRSKSNAVIHDQELLFEHVFKMVKEGQIKTISGGNLAAKIDTICVHGDTPKAVELVAFLNQKLIAHNLKIETAF